MRSALCLVLVLGGCPRKGPPPALVEPTPELDLLQRAQDRQVPVALRSRFGFKIKSKKLGLSGSTGGALIVDRPGNGHLAVLGPFGGPLAMIQTDGTGVAVLMPRSSEHAVIPNAHEQLVTLTEAVAGLPDVVDLMVGKLPARATDPEAVQSTTPSPEDGTLRFTLAGPRDTVVQLALDAQQATPRSIDVARADGVSLLAAEYGPFQPMDDGTLMPGEATFVVPALELTLDVRYRSWTQLTEDVPAVFSQEPPEGFTTGILNLARMLGSQQP